MKSTRHATCILASMEYVVSVSPGPRGDMGALKLSLCPFPSPAEERSVTHTGLPILVSLANRAVSFSCSITYPYTPKFKDFTVSYFYVDLQGQTSFVEKISCQPGTGSENQTHTTVCPITLKPRNASATGTYYCSVYWPDTRMTGKGTFILVRGELPLQLFAGHRVRQALGAQEQKWGVFASPLSFGTTELSHLRKPLATQVCRDAHLHVERAESGVWIGSGHLWQALVLRVPFAPWVM